MEVSKGGAVVGWVLARGYDNGLAVAARTEGYSVGTGVKAARGDGGGGEGEGVGNERRRVGGARVAARRRAAKK